MQGSAVYSQESGSRDTNAVAIDGTTLFRELYLKGLQQKSAGQLSDAQRTFEQLVELQPDSDAAHYELARIFFDRQNFEAAAHAAKRATAINPDNEWYWTTLLDSYKQTGNISEMPEVFSALIRLNPENEAYYYNKGYILYVNKRFEEALEVYDKITEVFGETEDKFIGKSQIYLAMDNHEGAIKELEALVAKEPDVSRGYILLAELYVSIKNGRKALSTLDLAEKRFPQDPLVWLSKADTYQATGKSKPAYDYLRKAFLSEGLDIDTKAGILYTALSNEAKQMDGNSLTRLADVLVETYPREPKSHAVRGDVYAQLNQPEIARKSYLNALEINMYLEPVWLQLLQVELQMGLFDEVVKHGVEASGLFPQQYVIMFFTGHGLLGNKKHEEARKYFEEALNNADEENSPLMTQLYSSLGDVYNALDMHAESDVAYQEAIALDSNNAYALNNYAYYLALRKEKLDQAAEMAKRAVELEPDVEHYEDTYAWVLFQQGKYDEALLWIERAMKNSQQPSDVLHEHFGDILALNGKIEAAVVQWKKAKTISLSVGKDIDKLSQKINEKQYID